MAGLLSWWVNDEFENEPSEKLTTPGAKKPSANGGQYVTQEDMMNALDKLQKRIEDRLHAERNKRAQRCQQLSDDMAKRFAEVELNMALAINAQEKHIASLPQEKTVGAISPADVQRLAETLAQREPRYAALVGEKASVGPLGPSGAADVRSMISGVSDSGGKSALLEELNLKVERLEKGSRKLVAAAAAALSGRSSDEFPDDEAHPSTRSVGNLGTMSEPEPPGFDDKVLAITTRLDTYESDTQMLGRRVADIEVKMKAFELGTGRRVQASMKRPDNKFWA